MDTSKFQNVHQVGGIRTALIDHPCPGGAPGAGGRIAMVNTGAGLRYTVALDRGGDIVEAFHHQHSLAYLTVNDYKAGNPAYHRGDEWLTGWPGGLLTSCGPQYVGQPRNEDGTQTNLHGHHSNTPAAVEMILNPDPHQDRHEMLLSMIIRDSRMYAPMVEVRRQIQGKLGINEIHLYDQVTNRGDEPVPHNWLYHVNFGYPLLDVGTQLVFKGKLDTQWDMRTPINAGDVETIKATHAAQPAPASKESFGVIVEPEPDSEGLCHVGIVNRQLSLGVEMEFSPECLPRMANWQWYGPRGCFVSALEPFAGSLMGKAKDASPLANLTLAPGETRRYRMTLKVHSDAAALDALMKYDGALRM
ncbi:MAG: DUF4432 family protein [Phycisphaeraceae bacterium]